MGVLHYWNEFLKLLKGEAFADPIGSQGTYLKDKKNVAKQPAFYGIRL